jgi:hypothetical protein
MLLREQARQPRRPEAVACLADHRRHVALPPAALALRVPPAAVPRTSHLGAFAAHRDEVRQRRHVAGQRPPLQTMSSAHRMHTQAEVCRTHTTCTEPDNQTAAFNMQMGSERAMQTAPPTSIMIHSFAIHCSVSLYMTRYVFVYIYLSRHSEGAYPLWVHVAGPTGAVEHLAVSFCFLWRP